MLIRSFQCSLYFNGLILNTQKIEPSLHMHFLLVNFWRASLVPINNICSNHAQSTCLSRWRSNNILVKLLFCAFNPLIFRWWLLFFNLILETSILYHPIIKVIFYWFLETYNRRRSCIQLAFKHSVLSSLVTKSTICSSWSSLIHL